MIQYEDIPEDYTVLLMIKVSAKPLFTKEGMCELKQNTMKSGKQQICGDFTGVFHTNLPIIHVRLSRDAIFEPEWKHFTSLASVSLKKLEIE